MNIYVCLLWINITKPIFIYKISSINIFNFVNDPALKYNLYNLLVNFNYLILCPTSSLISSIKSFKTCS